MGAVMIHNLDDFLISIRASLGHGAAALWIPEECRFEVVNTGNAPPDVLPEVPDLEMES